MKKFLVTKDNLNISNLEPQTLLNMKMKDGVVLKADKGSVRVIMNKKDYIAEGSSDTYHISELIDHFIKAVSITQATLNTSFKIKW